MKKQSKTPQTPHMNYAESHMENPTVEFCQIYHYSPYTESHYDIASNTL